MSKLCNASLACATLITLTYASADAAEMKVSGTMTQVIVSNEAEKLADGRTLLRLHDKGVVEVSDPKSPVHLAKQDCFYTVLLDAQGSVADGGGYCSVIDKDNDGFLSWWHFSSGGSVWNVYHGNGKYAGMNGSGTTKPLVNFPDRYTIAYEGTLTMK